MSACVSTLPAPPSDEVPCHCPTSTPWDDRKDDGPWVIDGQIVGYQRTCQRCGASKTIEVG